MLYTEHSFFCLCELSFTYDFFIVCVLCNSWYFLSRDFKVLVANFALGAKLPVRGQKDALDKEIATCSSSCKGNTIDSGAWWAAVHGVTQSRTQLGE